jgi:hypothetical protein
MEAKNLDAWALLILLLLSLLPAAPVQADQAGGPTWFAARNGAKPAGLEPDEKGEVRAAANFPGSLLVYRQADRRTLRPDPDFFAAEELAFDVTVEGGPARANLFLKDKDGFWFQSVQDFSLNPGRKQRLSVRLAAVAGDLRPVGHQAAWSTLHASAVHMMGVSFYSAESGQVRVACSPPTLLGRRSVPDLRVLDWRMPASGEQFSRLESTFDLTREYLNPFDPETIAVDVEVAGPAGKNLIFPAFLNQDFRFTYHFTQETRMPVGKPYWTFRFTPRQPGDYRLRLVVKDRSGTQAEVLKTAWRELRVAGSDRRGFVRVSQSNRRFFEFDNGDWFFPLGLNIHTAVDRRSERGFNLGRMPDRGVRDYEKYFAAMHEHGLNTAEVWMAAWSLGIEWSAEMPFYQGMGRYNLANASALDRVLEAAEKNGIYLNLTLDNHGKLSATSDQEWFVSPYYSEGEFAVANGGFLKEPKEFFTDEKARQYNRARNRYVAARWGACTNIIGMELVSEVDLVTGHKEAYADGTSLTWHQETMKELRSWDQGEHLLTSHVCGDYKRNRDYQNLFKLAEFDYVVGDAYRPDTVHFVDQMRGQEELLGLFADKPIWITEFGGKCQAKEEASRLVGDIHCGPWSALFKQQAGAPLFWWHDFVYLNNYFSHYDGFNAFVRDLDPRTAQYEYREIGVVDYTLPDKIRDLRAAEQKEAEEKLAKATAQLKKEEEKLPDVQKNVDRRVEKVERMREDIKALLGEAVLALVKDAKGTIAVLPSAASTVEPTADSATKEYEAVEAELKKLVGGKACQAILAREAANRDGVETASAKTAFLEKALVLVQCLVEANNSLEAGQKWLAGRKKTIERKTASVATAKAECEVSRTEIECLSMGNDHEIFGWIFCRPRILDYPTRTTELGAVTGARLTPDYQLKPGDYEAVFYDTLSGREVGRVACPVQDAKVQIAVPDFEIDLAFKLRIRDSF